MLTLAELSLALSNEGAEGAKAGLECADIVGNDWLAFVVQLNNEDKWACNTALSGRSRFNSLTSTDDNNAADTEPQPESTIRCVEAIYFGHNQVESALSIGNLHNIDTGAYRTSQLCVMCLFQQKD